MLSEAKHLCIADRLLYDQRFFASQDDIGKMLCKPEETLASSLSPWQMSFAKFR